MAGKKAKPETDEKHFLTLADIDKVFTKYNTRWVQPEFTLFYSSMDWRGSERDIEAYFTIGKHLYKPGRFFVNGSPEKDGDLRVFLGMSPAHLDLTDMFSGQAEGQPIEVSKEQQRVIIEKLRLVQKTVIDFWVNTLTSGRTMAEMMVILEPVRYKGAIFASTCILDSICEQLGNRYKWDELQRTYSMVFRKELSMPEFAGTSDVKCLIYEKNGVGQRYWINVRKGLACGSISAKLVLETGAYAVVTAVAADDKARDFCERLLKRGAFDDVILLIGEGEALAQAAKKMSAFLYSANIFAA